MRPFLLALLLLGWFTPALLQAATITGIVQLPEMPPQRRIVHRYSKADLEQMGQPAPVIAVVSLRGDLPSRDVPMQAVLRQEGLQFFPRILPVLTGSTVTFPNLDNTYHNVFSYSPEKRFDLGRYQKGEGPPSVTFDKPGEIAVFCEVHEHMRAYVLVLETPWFVSTDVEGRFEIRDVPKGTYTLDVWISPRLHWEQEITVTDDILDLKIQQP